MKHTKETKWPHRTVNTLLIKLYCIETKLSRYLEPNGSLSQSSCLRMNGILIALLAGLYSYVMGETPLKTHQAVNLTTGKRCTALLWLSCEAVVRRAKCSSITSERHFNCLIRPFISWMTSFRCDQVAPSRCRLQDPYRVALGFLPSNASKFLLRWTA